MKLDSAPLWPKIVHAKGIPTNLVENMTPVGEYQIARVLAQEGEFEILYSGTQTEGQHFLQEQIEKDYPGLL